MGAGQVELEGPDLTAGIAIDRLADGRPVFGHVNGKAVLLVRHGDDLVAVGATCTHYGGPLVEGLVVGDTIRCPWHHACFSLRTGEALAAPALNPLPRWRVAARDGIAYVVGEEEPAPPLSAAGRRAEGPGSVVIVGAGAAGSAAAEMLRREGFIGAIAMVDPDPAAPYDRPNLSKDYLAGTAPEEWIPLRPEGFYEQNGIERVVARAEALDPGGRSLRLSNGRTLHFDALLLATGAAPVRPGIPGADLPHVFTLRSLADCRAIIGATGEARRAVIIGAGFVGMETAAALRTRGLEVTVVAPETVPFERALGIELGRLLRVVHEERGVAFRLGRTVSEIDRQWLRLDDGSRLAADLVVLGTGVRPDTALAGAAGLAVDDGVLVDEYLETSVPGIFAAGDAARWPDARTGRRVRIEHWVVAQRQGQAAARSILGRREPFTDVPFFWTQHYDLPVTWVGHAGEWDEVAIEGDPLARDAAVRYLRDGVVLAVATVHRDRQSLEAEAALQSAAAAAAAAPRVAWTGAPTVRGEG